MPKLKHLDKLNTARFVTFSCFRRYRLLKHPILRDRFLKHLTNFRRKYNVAIFGYVIMPNHVHLVLYPREEIQLGPAIGRLKSGFAFEVIKKWKQENHGFLQRLKTIRGGNERFAFWHVRCYDYNCRTNEEIIEKLNYCHKNPVTAGLVKEPADWKWSSYNWYYKRDHRQQLLQIDDF